MNNDLEDIKEVIRNYLENKKSLAFEGCYFVCKSLLDDYWDEIQNTDNEEIEEDDEDLEEDFKTFNKSKLTKEDEFPEQEEEDEDDDLMKEFNQMQREDMVEEEDNKNVKKHNKKSVREEIE